MPNSIRTYTPIFSYVGFGKMLEPKIKDLYKPFDSGSELHALLNSDADVLFYGASISAFTFIHYIEEQNHIEYRYTKKINGVLQVNEKFHTTSVELKVRPLGKTFNYDWRKIENDLKESKILRSIKNGENENSIFKLSESMTFITKQLKLDPYYLLDQQTKEWVNRLLNQMKRPFLMEDFEEQSK
jgi:aminoglycoside 3-N-acetyltransferase